MIASSKKPTKLFPGLIIWSDLLVLIHVLDSTGVQTAMVTTEQNQESI